MGEMCRSDTLTGGVGRVWRRTGGCFEGRAEIEYAFARTRSGARSGLFDARRRPIEHHTMARSGKPSEEDTSSKPASPASYEEALAELEQLVGKMESGALPLDHLLASYQRGAQLLQFCRARLEAVEQQVKLLEDGQLKPWGEA